MRATVIVAAAAAILFNGPTWAATDAEKRDVIKTYVEIAHAAYGDSLATANSLKVAVNKFLAAPSHDGLAMAREAWIAARIPYQQTEAYRFGNPIVDDWEGKVNSWPLDEGLIDYVATDKYGEESDENAYYTANVIANKVLQIGGKTIDASHVTKELLSDTLQEIGGIEANVATGYHAIEFLLWGQDLNGTGPGAGSRPASDYDVANCTHGNCDRRADYLRAATELLVDDLAWMTAQWAPGGEARTRLTSGDPNIGLITILTGMGSLSYGELAGERMKLGLMLHDPEEEQDCFSDNTHASHYNDAKGIRNVYLGEYRRVDGSMVTGPSISALVAKEAPDVDKELRARLDNTQSAMQAMVDMANKGVAYDQMIGAENAAGNKVVQAVIDALTVQTKSIERAVAVLKLQRIAFEGSDSLDNPSAVGK